MSITFFISILGLAHYLAIISPEPDESFWCGASVVYADVVDVKPDEYQGMLILLKPYATLSGNFDAAFHGEIPAHAIVNRGFADVSVIRTAPTKGSKVLAVILDTITAKGQQIYLVPNGNVKFVPGHVGIVEVTGFDDPKVTEMIENLRQLRGKQREEAEKAKAEQKPAAENAAEKKSPPRILPVK